MCHTSQEQPTLEDRIRVANVKPEALNLNRQQVGVITGMSYKWLETAAREGKGPPCHKIGNRCLYNRKKLLAWLASKEAAE